MDFCPSAGQSTQARAAHAGGDEATKCMCPWKHAPSPNLLLFAVAVPGGTTPCTCSLFPRRVLAGEEPALPKQGGTSSRLSETRPENNNKQTSDVGQPGTCMRSAKPWREAMRKSIRKE